MNQIQPVMFPLKFKKKRMKTFLYLAFFSLLVACSGSEAKNSSSEQNETDKSSIPANKERVEIRIAALGESMAELAFEPKSISVPANSTVVLTFENKSSAEGMYHNFVLVELGSGQEISSAGIKAGKSKEFIPNDDRVITHTKVTDMGETVTIEFDAPAKGSYHYVCTYPGHTSMIGRFNVE